MNSPNIEIARLALRGLAPKDRAALLCEISGQAAESQPERLLRRMEVARRLSCSLRLVDLLAHNGALQRIKLPGRKRGHGFLASEIDALLAGGGAQ